MRPTYVYCKRGHYGLSRLSHVIGVPSMHAEPDGDGGTVAMIHTTHRNIALEILISKDPDLVLLPSHRSKKPLEAHHLEHLTKHKGHRIKKGDSMHDACAKIAASTGGPMWHPDFWEDD